MQHEDYADERTRYVEIPVTPVSSAEIARRLRLLPVFGLLRASFRAAAMVRPGPAFDLPARPHDGSLFTGPPDIDKRLTAAIHEELARIRRQRKPHAANDDQPGSGGA